MTLKACSVPGCGCWATHRGRCARHAAEARKARDMSGYGYAHQKRRAQLKARALNTRCPDCGTWMTDRAYMAADHSVPLSVDPTSIADRVHCKRCSDRQGGRLSRTGRA